MERKDSYNLLNEFEKTYSAGAIDTDLILFDLHLEDGRKATEVLSYIDKRQKYAFMASDYLNPDLVNEAEKRRFSIIPKELVGFALKRDDDLGANSILIAEAEGV